MFSQEAEILVLVHRGDKDSITGRGRCVFLKGKLLFTERGKGQKLLEGGCFVQAKEQIHSITDEINYTEKTVRRGRGNPKFIEGKCTKSTKGGKADISIHVSKLLGFFRERKDGMS